MTAAQERLHNLGFLIEGERGAPGPRTRAAVRAFQRHHGLAETGQLADVQRELIRRHDT
ncbi:peptidoglycan-binding domain-containing protein [Corallococcus terminator]